MRMLLSSVNRCWQEETRRSRRLRLRHVLLGMLRRLRDQTTRPGLRISLLLLPASLSSHTQTHTQLFGISPSAARPSTLPALQRLFACPKNDGTTLHVELPRRVSAQGPRPLRFPPCWPSAP
jgi:hypothetical protein